MLRAFSTIIEGLYANDGSPRGWIPLLEPIADFVGGEVAQLVVADHARRRLAPSHFFALTPNIDIDVLESFMRHHGPTDPRRPVAHARVGRIWRDHNIEPDGFDTSPIVADVLDPMGVRRQIGALVVRDADTLVTLNVMRPRGQGPFEDDAIQRFGALLPHLRNAFEMHARIHAPATATEGLAGVLDGLLAPLVVVDGKGRVVYANKAAETAATEKRWSLRGGRIAGSSADDDAALAAAIEAATQGPDGRSPIATPLALRGDGQAGALRLLVSPVARTGPVAGVGGQPLVQVLGLIDRPATLGPAFLRRFFGLTNAEARVAAELGDGRSLQEAADRLGIARSSAKSHLNALFAKTSTSRQADLVRLLVAVHESQGDPSTR